MINIRNCVRNNVYVDKDLNMHDKDITMYVVTRKNIPRKAPNLLLDGNDYIISWTCSTQKSYDPSETGNCHDTVYKCYNSIMKISSKTEGHI